MTARERRFFVVGSVIVLGAALMSRVALPAARVVQTKRQEADQIAHALSRGRALSKDSVLLNRSLIEARSRFSGLKRGLLKGGTAIAAAADLASTVERAAEASGVTIIRLNPTASPGKDSLGRVDMRVEGSGDTGRLAQFLWELENAEDRLMSVTELVITHSQAPISGGQANRSVRIMVSGWFLSGEGW